jgi:small-conductance mechanosensitive channel
MPRGRKVTDKISAIEDDLSATLFAKDRTSEEDSSDEPVLVEPDFENNSATLDKVQNEIDKVAAAASAVDEEFQAYAADLQEQLTQRQTQVEEEKTRLRIRMIELNGLKKYLNNELF